jgi:hypothetical protein
VDRGITGLTSKRHLNMVDFWSELGFVVFDKDTFIEDERCRHTRGCQIETLEGDFSEDYDGPENNTNVSYVAACLRSDHPLVMAGVTPEGYWTGTATNDFNEALKDELKHGHPEAGSLQYDRQYVLPVWAAQ